MSVTLERVRSAPRPSYRPRGERRGWLNDHEAAGRLRPEVEQLLSDGGTLAAAARLLLDRHFTPLLADLICAEVDLDLPA